ncbi:MAG: Ni/Fe-hydrogenase, b-type cytochrome subunit [Rhodospirillaceae bacterium]
MVRLWHWVSAICILILVLTGYLIGSPLPSTTGEPAEWFVMGYIRFAHFAASYVFTIGLVFRSAWALLGNRMSRELFYLPIWSARWSQGLVGHLRWLAFLQRREPSCDGYNPIARVALFFLFLLPSLFMIVTGFAIYSEATGRDSWQHRAFGWIVEFWRNTQDIHTLHRLGMWAIAVFVVVHVYFVVRDDIMSQRTVISAMISGVRYYRRR